MSQLVKIAAFILCFTFSQIIFADVCDFKYSGDYYVRIAEPHERPGLWLGGSIIESGAPDAYDDFKLNIPDTTRYPNRIGIRTWIGKNCLETKSIRFDSLGNIKTSSSYIEKDNHILQMTLNDVVKNIEYDVYKKRLAILR